MKTKVPIFISFFILYLLYSPSAWAEKIGFYFGTFDPPHRGHIQLANKTKEKLGLDKLFILPNYIPSKKPNASSFKARHNMVKLVTLRHPGLAILPPSAFKKAHQRNQKNYIGELIQVLRETQGVQHQYFHLVGTDSFNKMVHYGKLPIPEENRTVAVIQRQGYALRRPPEVIQALKRKQVRLLDLNLPQISSSKIRKGFQSKNIQSAQRFLPPYLTDFIIRNRLYGQKEHSLNLYNWPVPKGYRSQIPKLPQTDKIYHKAPLNAFLNLKNLSSPLTLDADAYLKSKWPESIRKLLTQTNVKVEFMEGLWPDTLAYLRQKGYKSLKLYERKRNRIGLAFILGKKNKQPTLIITHIFGRDRVYHQLQQVARLMTGSGRSLSDLSLFLDSQGAAISHQVFSKALKAISLSPKHTVFMGYHGALNYLISDLKQYNKGVKSWPKDLKTLDLWIEKHRRKLTHPAPYGSAYLPYWTYHINGHQIISFRNTYGETSGVLSHILKDKGLKDLVVFGNGGGLSKKTQLHRIYAPISAEFQKTAFSFKNPLSNVYPAVSLLKVQSVLDETPQWLERAKVWDLVDVENYDIFWQLKDSPQVTVRSALLISDRPNQTDITLKNEDAQILIHRKRTFFFDILKELW